MLPLCQVTRRRSICPGARGSRFEERCDGRDYFLAASLLPNFWRNFSTRPAVSMIFCWPV